MTKLPIPKSTQIGDYRIVEYLGRGATSEIYAARDRLLGRKVALKVLLAGLRSGPNAAGLRFEGRALAALNHPNIVQIYGMGWHGARPYLVLELLEGMDLRSRLRSRGLRLPSAVQLGARMASALMEAHRNNIIHCDVKPENIYLPGDGRPRLLDFGLCRVVSRSSGRASDSHSGLTAAGNPTAAPGYAFGTPQYMPPEQWRGGRPDRAADIWSLGATLYEMLTGRHAFEGVGDENLARAVLAGTAPRADSGTRVPAVLADLVAACLERDPAKRPSASALIAELTRVRREFNWPMSSRIPPPLPRGVANEHLTTRRLRPPPHSERTRPA